MVSPPAPIALPACCPGCGLVLDRAELRRRLCVCRCGRHFPMAADEWVGFLADPGTWRERWADLRPVDILEWSRPRPYRATLDEAAARGLNEAVRCGVCALHGREVALGVFDFGFVGGTLGMVSGERLARLAELAVADRLPMVVVAASGGARMQEGVCALLQMAKVNAAISELHAAGLPYLTVLSHPTYGGTAASLALIGDVNIAEPGAAIGFTGPRVIELATHQRLPAVFQTAEFQLDHGQVDMIVPRPELRATLAALRDLLG